MSKKYDKAYMASREKLVVKITPETSKFLLACLSFSLLCLAKDKAGTKDAMHAVLHAALDLQLGSKEELLVGLPTVDKPGAFALPPDFGALMTELCEIAGIPPGPHLRPMDDEDEDDEDIHHFEVRITT